MTRSDLPYAVLTALFGVVVFAAGRYSAPVHAAPEPRVVVLHDVAPAPSPSVVIITPTPEPPLALLPEVTPVAASSSATAKPGGGEAHAITSASPKTSTPTPAVSVFLEETPEKTPDQIPPNPYKTSSNPGF